MPGSNQPQAGAANVEPAVLAPPWHTALLIALIVAVAVTGLALQRRGIAVQSAATPRSTVYLQTIVVAWGLLFYVCVIGRARNALPALLGKGWPTLGRAAVDGALAAAGWLLIRVCEHASAALFGSAPGHVVSALLPQSAGECALWVVLSLSVGLSEEVVYRGYLQTQLASLRFTGRAGVAMLLQALLFGLAHAEQGAAAMARLTVYGLAFAALARWRRSLLPGILCHVLNDLTSGLLRL